MANSKVAQSVIPSSGKTSQSGGSNPTATLSHEQIASRAYQKWRGRENSDGSPENDWFQAEAELRTELKTKKAPRSGK